MKQILVKSNIVQFGDGHPIPPLYVVREPVELVARLWTTKSGANARWTVVFPDRGEEISSTGRGQLSPEDRGCLGLNRARRSPVIRAVAERFVWAPADTRDCPAPPLRPLVEGQDGLPLVIQEGSMAVNWAAAIRSPLPDPVREGIQKVLQASRVRVATQGGLEVHRVAGIIPEERLDFLRKGSGNRRLLNHFIIGHDGLAYRVVDGRYVAVLRVREGSRCFVLSPDHPDQPVELVGWNRDEIFVLIHPHPRSRVD